MAGIISAEPFEGTVSFAWHFKSRNATVVAIDMAFQGNIKKGDHVSVELNDGRSTEVAVIGVEFIDSVGRPEETKIGLFFLNSVLAADRVVVGSRVLAIASAPRSS